MSGTWRAVLLLAVLTSAVHASSSSTKNDSALCKDGLILPAWHPLENLGKGDIIARGLVYFLGLIYMFVGVSIIADRFMASIEVITSKEREVTIKKPNGETQTISVRIWNETVSNLTLMALGSSAPEILLSIIEVYAQNFEAGDLGPGTIVGSAAFNMFVIIAICVWAIPCNENRRIKHLRVFFVTMTWSVFAYIWLYIILAVTSSGEIEVWEGLLTFFFFPATVLTAYIADRRLLLYKYLSKKYRMNKRGIIVGGEGGEGDVEMSKANHLIDGGFKVFEEGISDEMQEFEEHRREYIQLLRELRKKHPDCTMEQLEMMAREELLNSGPKSRAYYRIQATRKLMGGGNLMKKRIEKQDLPREEEEKRAEVKDNVTRLCFDPGHYTVMENVGQFEVTVSREGDTRLAIAVDYETEDGTANAGSDYEAARGTLIFRPGETHKQFSITVIDDDVFEEDEHFYVRLSNPRYVSTGSVTQENLIRYRPPLELGTPHIATVMILDDDHGGIFTFAEAEQEIPESIGVYNLVINRYSGARGRVLLPYRTVDGTAKAGKDFEPVNDAVWFENNETTKEVPIAIVDNESYERDSVFYVELGYPKSEEDVLKEAQGEDEAKVEEGDEEDKIALLGKPRLGDTYRIQIRIKESREFKNTVDKLFSKANTSLMIGSSSWKEQFIEAVTVSAGDDDGGDDEEGSEAGEKMPSCSDYVLHFFTLFWKVLFAFVPPTEWWGGWLCFTLSIVIIGILTAFIGDLASHFGCTIGLKDAVTAVAFVALGTSVPDTFASKVAAVNDKYADSSIGNVTGSNAVNVFLGIGIAWSIAAIYHASHNSKFKVQPGTLAFSVTIFCVCAGVACAVLLLRRGKAAGGELGGPMRYKLPTTILFVGLWCFYVLMSSLEAYGIVKGF